MTLPITEFEWLNLICADLTDNDLQLKYADWLEQQDDSRAGFLRAFVSAKRSPVSVDLPDGNGFTESWLELIGYRLVKLARESSLPWLQHNFLKLARPALRMKKPVCDDADIPLGASKLGGWPDLPLDVAWPQATIQELPVPNRYDQSHPHAGFLGQLNFRDTANTQAGQHLPKEGLLLFFSFLDTETCLADDSVGVKTIYVPKPVGLVRTPPQILPEDAITMIPSRRLLLEETLDLPDTDTDGPWRNDYLPMRVENEDAVFVQIASAIDPIRLSNFSNILGYARATTGSDPTPSKHWRHLILLKEPMEAVLHVQIESDNLAKHRFDTLRVTWIDWD